MEECFCCFLEVEKADAHPITASWKFGDYTITTDDLIVCTACRRLECDVMNPRGCKRPEASIYDWETI